METVVDARGRVLIPQRLREDLGLDAGAVVQVRKSRGTVVITLAKRRRRAWKQLNGVKPKRTGRAEWPSPEDIKNIWKYSRMS
jgi:bifunctional DNA-binding transcriptional regulator/antitoxin component of YhaV-PrlF toxin-antitoxin module